MEDHSKKIIAIVGNAGENKATFEQIFGMKYEIIEDTNLFEAAKKIITHKDRLAAVVLDVMAPEKEGYAIMDAMNKQGLLQMMPVFVMITKDVAPPVELGCYRKGASAVIRKPYGPLVIKERLSHWIELYQTKRELETRVQEQSAAMREQFKKMQERETVMHSMDERMIEKIATIIEFRNLESKYHLERIRGFTRVLATTIMQNYPEYGLDAHKIEVMTQASVIHDVGKITISDTILLKPGRLTDEEFEIMESHTTRGCDIVRMLVDVQDKEYYDMCMDIVRHHHEKYDGRGYPDGLRGEEISIAAQIVALADVYDALVSERIYKSAFTTEKAHEMIKNGECGLFSVKLLNCFDIAKGQMEEVVERTRAQEAAEMNAE